MLAGKSLSGASLFHYDEIHSAHTLGIFLFPGRMRYHSRRSTKLRKIDRLQIPKGFTGLALSTRSHTMVVHGLFMIVPKDDRVKVFIVSR